MPRTSRTRRRSNASTAPPPNCVAPGAGDPGTPYRPDVAQPVGQRPFDTDETGGAVLWVRGRNSRRGPRGPAFLYVGSSLLARLDPPFLDMRAADWVEPGRYELR